jgi:hypothetical protein
MSKPENVQVKAVFAPAQLRLLRLAAASQNLSTTAFLKRWGLAAAAQEMRGFRPPVGADEPSAVPTQRRSRKG